MSKWSWLKAKPKRKAYANRAGNHDSTFYQTQRWRTFRKNYLSHNPLCVRCYGLGLITAAVILDHITQRSKGGADYAEDNVQGLCRKCHAIKSGREAHQ